MQQNFPAVPTSNTLPLIVADVEIRRDAQGRYCLNDLHKSSGGEERHSPNRWLRTDGCKSLILAITPKMAYSPVESKQQVGTFVVKQLVYAYAMWISAEFHLRVIDTFDAVVTGQYQPTPVDPMQLLNDPAVLKNLLLANIQQNEEQKLQIGQRDKMIADLAPKAQVTDRLMGAEGNLTIRNSAKALKMKEHKFTDWLQIKKFAYRDKKGKLVGYSDHVPRYLDHKVHPIPTDGEPDRVSFQLMITPEGLVKFAKLLNVDLSEQENFFQEAA